MLIPIGAIAKASAKPWVITGVVEIDNLARILDDARAPWMDSCAAPGHPMIDSLWGERRSIAQYRVSLRKPGLAGVAGILACHGITATERLHRAWKRRNRA